MQANIPCCVYERIARIGHGHCPLDGIQDVEERSLIAPPDDQWLRSFLRKHSGSTLGNFTVDGVRESRHHWDPACNNILWEGDSPGDSHKNLGGKIIIAPAGGLHLLVPTTP